MYALISAALLLLSPAAPTVQSAPAELVGPLAQSFYPAEDDDRPDLFLPEPGDSDASNFEPVEGDSDPDNFESPDLDELAVPARSPDRAQA